MPDPGETARLLDLVRQGDQQALNDLIAHACERLRALASRMLKSYPGVRRWEQADDVLQNALIRLHRALEQTKPESPRHFYNLATLNIRRELIDLARHHSCPQGHGANHFTDAVGKKAADDNGGPLDVRPDERHEPSDLESWTVFHEQVDSLPDDEREMFGLIWYEGLAQDQAANVLGVSLRTAKRRWQSARLLLAKVCRTDEDKA